MLDDENVDNDVTTEDENSESELSKDDFVDDNHVWVDETPIGNVSSDTSSNKSYIREFLISLVVVYILFAGGCVACCSGPLRIDGTGSTTAYISVADCLQVATMVFFEYIVPFMVILTFLRCIFNEFFKRD